MIDRGSIREPQSIRNGHRNRIAVAARSWRRLGRHAAEDGEALRSAIASSRNSVRANRIAPYGRTARIGVERIIDRIRTTGHLADSHCRTSTGTGIEADVIRRSVGALNLQR